MDYTPIISFFSGMFQRRNDHYKYGWSVLRGATRFNNYHGDHEKLTAVLSNPAVLKVFALQCDMFSRAKVKVTDLSGKEIENDPFLQRLRAPNPFQSQSQFLWDFMFFLMLGNAYCYSDSKVVTSLANPLYFLTPHKMQWPQSLQKNADKLLLSKASIDELSKEVITYRYEDGTGFRFTLANIIHNADLTNGVGNWLKGPSRIEALYKIISNSEHALDSKNINVRYVGKFLVGSTGDIGKTPMSDTEKEDIEDKVDTADKRVWAIRSQINIRRFVENLAQQELGKTFLEDYFLIGMMYGIPRDVLEAYNSSTFENQEKARGAHVAYCLEPKGEQFMDSFEKYYGYTSRNIVLTWDHLAFTQVFEQQRQAVKAAQIKSFSDLVKAGISAEQANEFLGTKFILPPPTAISADNSDPATLAAQAALRGSVGGVQGVLNVQASVAAGTTTFEAALSILTIIYGFTESQAKDILGVPKIV